MRFQLLFAPFRVGDIPAIDDIAVDCRVVELIIPTGLKPTPGSVGVPRSELDDRRRIGAVDPPFEALDKSCTVVGLNILSHSVADGLLGVVSQNALNRGALVLKHPVSIHDGNKIIRLLDEHLEPLFTPAAFG